MQIFPFDKIDEAIDSFKTTQPIKDIVFVTGNNNKVKELQSFLHVDGVSITTRDIDLLEIQDADVLNIVAAKCKGAYERIRREGRTNCCVMIEDTCLGFRALNGMPGPYIKWFMKAVGAEGLHQMLVGFEDKRAEAVCIYALMTDESRILFCRGSVQGRIVEPRGASWGWDPVFEEERCSRTFGELKGEEKLRFSHRSAALTVLKKILS